MRVALLSREFPPEVYGGAGVHVEYLVRELRPLVDLDVHCFGAPREESVGATAHRPPPALAGANPALATLAVDLDMVAGIGDSDAGALPHLVRRGWPATSPGCSTTSRTW